MDYTNPMHPMNPMNPMNPVNPNPLYARTNPANVWHTIYTETEQAEPEPAARDYPETDAPFVACFCAGVLLVLVFVIVAFAINIKEGGR